MNTTTDIFPKITDILDEENKLIKITRPITPDFADVCVEAIHQLAKKSSVIDIYVNCEGVYTNDAVRIMLALLSYNKLNYWVTGYADKALGASFLILQGCQVSVGFANSQLYLGRFKADPKLYKELTKKDLVSEKSVFKFLAEITGNALKDIYRLADEGKIMTAAEAVEKKLLGLVQSKRPSHLP